MNKILPTVILLILAVPLVWAFKYNLSEKNLKK